MNDLPVSDVNWTRLVEANQAAVKAGWGEDGVFGTGIGPEYGRDGFPALLYVGKSAGPLGGEVGSEYDQGASCRASTQWMLEFRNRSPFWQFVDRIDPLRKHIAWTNICKMDERGGKRPPRGSKWTHVAEACMAALADEMERLAPKVTVFATSGLYESNLRPLLYQLGFRTKDLDFDDRWTRLSTNANGRYVIETRHPQGWNSAERDRVIELVKSVLRE
jgi:hypothetical protein